MDLFSKWNRLFQQPIVYFVFANFLSAFTSWHFTKERYGENLLSDYFSFHLLQIIWQALSEVHLQVHCNGYQSPWQHW